MNYKLFVADMDGTLLDDNKELSNKNIKTIKKLQDFGIKFAVATGRHDSMIKCYLKHLNLHVPVISCNGAIVREPFSDQIFFSEALPIEQSLHVIDICKDSKAVFHIYGHESIYGENLSHKMLYYHNLNKTLPLEEQTKLVIVSDCKDIVLSESEPLYKFLIISAIRLCIVLVSDTKLDSSQKSSSANLKRGSRYTKKDRRCNKHDKTGKVRSKNYRKQSSVLINLSKRLFS